MTRLSGSGITAEVPAGWEGRIYARETDDRKFAGPAGAGGPEAAAESGAPRHAVLHIASFPLPPGVGDYGGGATEHMTNKDILIVLMEHGDASAGTPLFAAQGLPLLTADDVSPTRLQRMLEGQGGAQRFFSHNGRSFCLYVVFGSYARRVRTIPMVNDILRTISIT